MALSPLKASVHDKELQIFIDAGVEQRTLPKRYHGRTYHRMRPPAVSRRRVRRSFIPHLISPYKVLHEIKYHGSRGPNLLPADELFTVLDSLLAVLITTIHLM